VSQAHVPAREALPALVFEAPLFRGMDARALRELEGAARTLRYGAGAPIYAEGARGEAFFIVTEGEVELSQEPRPGAGRSVVRRARAGDSFGEDATALGTRQSAAVAASAAAVVEIPVHLFRRAAARSGRGELAERVERTLRRAAARDLLKAAPMCQHLDETSFDTVLDAATFQTVARGAPIYRAGEPSTALFVVCDGMVQIQTEEDERLRVHAYVTRGDFFGDEELETAVPRVASAVASGPATVLSIPGRVVRSLAEADPELFVRLRRVAVGVQGRQAQVIGRAAKNATQHLFRDLYRLQVARSLLVIDLDTCVRCGHCAWACGSLYGTSRLVRRGDRVTMNASAEPSFDVFRMRAEDVAGPAPAIARGPKNLMLPGSCQHCENPACMVDCPTGAIGKEPSGEVFIRESLCTGCGACARACPWNNIQMAPRPKDAPRPAGFLAEDLAVKCDLCKTFDRGPACVQVCPVEAIFRIDPSEELADVAAVLGKHTRAAPSARKLGESAIPALLGAFIASATVGAVGAVMQARGALSPSRGAGLGAGWLAALLMVGLLVYAAPKRGVRFWMKLGKRTKAPARSVTRPHYVAHLVLGLFAMGVAMAHAPGALPTAGGALFVALMLAGASGVALAGAYALVPSRLARIERKSLLPEDFAKEREAVTTRLYRAISGKSDVVKALADKVLLPYARSRLGPVALVLSGRDLAAEGRRLRVRADALLQGRAEQRLGGLDELIRSAVDLRALPAQRALLTILRVGLPIHLVSFAIAFALLFVHLIAVRAGFR
jgi:Fe-S-cluster-containing dehydrogenase component